MRNTKLALAVTVAIIAMHTQAQSQKPNIILILADDVGYKSLTCNGGNLYSTPNIDTLAKDGMRFTQCHASPLCSPSRFMLLTGKYNFRNYSKAGVMDTNEKTIGNIFRDAGYKTACFGKWQLSGADQSIQKFGFNTYVVHDAFDDGMGGLKYKNPHLYTHGAFLPDSLTLNKYGPDIVSDSLLDFIENNKSGPFFIYYSMLLVHQPYSPTPHDSAAFSLWDPHADTVLGDTSYFHSMMSYMDSKIEQLIHKLKSLNIDKNTAILFCGDNGTPKNVFEYIYNNKLIPGGKQSTTEAGTKVPLIAYWPGTIASGTVNHDLIDFTDFLPTLAGIANMPVPANYGPLDGVTFLPQLLGQPGTPRSWIFCHYDPIPQALIKSPLQIFKRWAQTKTYKLYDTCSINNQRRFYNISTDENEQHSIPDDSLTPAQAKIKQQLLNVINGYVAQGTPLISLNPSLSLVTDSSAVLRDTILINGGSTITASGAVWSTSPDPHISSSSHTSTGIIQGPFSTQLKGLVPDTTYYVKAYATNFAGTVYSNEVILKTFLDPPVATSATGIDSNRFTANWKAYAGATSYRLDVSTSPTFTKINTPTMTQGFNNGITPPGGWTISNNIIANATAFGIASPSLEFTASNARIVTSQLSGPAIQLKFWIKGLNTDEASSILVEGFNGSEWDTIVNLTKLPRISTVKTFNTTSNPPLAQNLIRFRFTYTKKAGTLAFDDVSIKYNNTVPSFIPGYNNLLVKTNSQTVSGLRAATNFYYRVRAIKGGIITGNSNVITVKTKAISITDTAQLYRPYLNINSVKKGANGSLDMQVSPNPSNGEFKLTLQTFSNEKVLITIMDLHGNILYRAKGNGDGKYIFGNTFAAGEYIVNVKSEKLNKTIKVIKTK